MPMNKSPENDWRLSISLGTPVGFPCTFALNMAKMHAQAEIRAVQYVNAFCALHKGKKILLTIVTHPAKCLVAQ
jgi:hypothetical protein